MSQNYFSHFQTKKSFLVLVLVLVFSSWSTIFAECNSSGDPGYSEYSDWAYSYECNVVNLCLGTRYGGDYWNFDTDKQLIIEHNKNKYSDLRKWKTTFEEIRKTYQSTQNTIMNCAILKSKYTLHKTLIDSYTLGDSSRKILEKANETIIKQVNDLKCISPRNDDKIYLYKDLLDSTSYEQCTYSMYLWYYQQVSENNIWLLADNKTSTTTLEVARGVNQKKQLVNNEYDLSNRTLDTALALYQNFEKSYTAHVLLQLLEVELTENKRYMGVVVQAIKQWVSLANNAQKSPSER